MTRIKTDFCVSGRLGYLVWGELPHPATVAGAAVVAASGIYVLHREIRRFHARD